MSDFNTKLDEILNTLLNVPMWFTEPDRHSELQDIVKKLPLSPQTDAAKQAIKALVLSDVIGEYERPASEASPLMKQLSPNTNRIDWRNELKEEQRNTLKGWK